MSLIYLIPNYPNLYSSPRYFQLGLQKYGSFLLFPIKIRPSFH